MTDFLTPKLTQSVADWIAQTARVQNISVAIYPGGTSLVGNWLHMPVSVEQGRDAYERASLLQQIEDLWEPADHNDIRLLLVPARSNTPTTIDGYAQLSELMQRQHQIIDQINTAPSETETVQRFQAVRQLWEEAIREMEQRHPHLKQEVA